jgi:DNA-binding NarL/FixJ family response regulator
LGLFLARRFSDTPIVICGMEPNRVTTPIRVLVANQPRLMRELVMATIADQPDIEIVGEVDDESKIAGAVERSHPDFLIIALGKSQRLPAVCEPILHDHPQIKVLAVPPARKDFVMFFWTASRVQSNRIEASEAGILRVIRGKERPFTRVE